MLGYRSTCVEGSVDGNESVEQLHIEDERLLRSAKRLRAKNKRKDEKDVDIIMEKFFESFADAKAMEAVNRGYWWKSPSDEDESGETGAVGTAEGGAGDAADGAGGASRADSEATVTYQRADSDSSNPTHDDISGEDLGSNDTNTDDSSNMREDVASEKNSDDSDMSWRMSDEPGSEEMESSDSYQDDNESGDADSEAGQGEGSADTGVDDNASGDASTEAGQAAASGDTDVEPGQDEAHHYFSSNPPSADEDGE